jgi:hypothetical protein
LTIEAAPPVQIGKVSINRPSEYRQVEITIKGEAELKFDKEKNAYYFIIGEIDLTTLAIEDVVKPTDDSNLAKAKPLIN